MTMHHAVPVMSPGDLIADELEVRGMTQRDLANRMGRPRQVINEIINGKRAITVETALQLEQALDISATFWIGLEGRYRLVLARNAAAERGAA